MVYRYVVAVVRGSKLAEFERGKVGIAADLEVILGEQSHEAGVVLGGGHSERTDVGRGELDGEVGDQLKAAAYNKKHDRELLLGMRPTQKADTVTSRTMLPRRHVSPHTRCFWQHQVQGGLRRSSENTSLERARNVASIPCRRTPYTAPASSWPRQMAVFGVSMTTFLHSSKMMGGVVFLSSPPEATTAMTAAMPPTRMQPTTMARTYFRVCLDLRPEACCNAESVAAPV